MKKTGLLKNNKGFTLIEMIIVLIIIAILAAIGIPAMIRYVDDARQKQNLAACRTVYVAAQAVVTQTIAEHLVPVGTVFSGNFDTSHFPGTVGDNAAAMATADFTASGRTFNLPNEIIAYADNIVTDEQFEVVGDDQTGRVLGVYYHRLNDDRNSVTIFANGRVVYNSGTAAQTETGGGGE